MSTDRKKDMSQDLGKPTQSNSIMLTACTLKFLHISRNVKAKTKVFNKSGDLGKSLKTGFEGLNVKKLYHSISTSCHTDFKINLTLVISQVAVDYVPLLTYSQAVG